MHELPLMAFFMNHSKRKSTAPPSLQCARGVTLVEVMVAIVVLSIGLLGIAGLQAATLKYKINTWARSSASTLLSDLPERFRITPDSEETVLPRQGRISHQSTSSATPGQPNNRPRWTPKRRTVKRNPVRLYSVPPMICRPGGNGSAITCCKVLPCFRAIEISGSLSP